MQFTRSSKIFSNRVYAPGINGAAVLILFILSYEFVSQGEGVSSSPAYNSIHIRMFPDL